MAEPLNYQVPKPSWTVMKTADEEVREFDDLLHERGVLRLVNNMLFSLPSVSRVFMEGIDNQAGANAIQNLTALIELIANLPPEQFRRVCRGMTVALQAAQDMREEESEPPGVTGALKLLHDEELWKNVAPLLRAASAFLEAQRHDTDLSPHAGPESTSRQ